MSVLELVINQSVIFSYLCFLIKNYRKPIDNYSELIFVRGTILVIAFSIANIWFYVDNISLVLLFWESVKGIFASLF